MRPGTAMWWDAVTSGRFFTIWSVVVALPLGVLVLAPYASVEAASDLGAALVSSLAVTVVLIVVLVPVALAERRLPWGAARGVVVLTSLVAAAAARPFLNEAATVGVFGLSPDPAWFERILTNVVAWVSVLSLVAITEQLYASSHAAMARLSDALRAVSDEQRRAGRFERESREFLEAEIGTLRDALSALLLSKLEFENVRDFSDIVRTASHRARARARTALADVLPDRATIFPPPPGRSFLARLRPAPVALAGTIFAAGSAPFAFRTGGPILLLVVASGVLGLSLVADHGVRRLSRHRSVRDRGAILVIVWSITGLVVAGAGAAVAGAGGLVPLVTIIALPGIAVIAALCADAVHRGRVEARRLGRALRAVVRSAAERSTATRQSLVHASDVLHGRVQGTCVVLAARVDDDLATASDIEEFEAAVADALTDALGTTGPGTRRVAGLDETVAAWQPVLAVESRVDAGAKSAMSDPLVSVQVVAVVAEGLVNAVKHASERTAFIEVTSAADGGLTVRVISPGELREDPARGGLGIIALGPTARVFQRSGDVVLEASVPAGGTGLVGAGQAGGALHDSDSM
ncbi:hypothetical protein [Microbacterium oleivorans]|uniref:Signal transduction histidine kinase n=1 Tax=Microbacterium oleivorans TaxID=273677 RepID=A0A7D5EXF1_9MICO|nr:hypothetical protein [Microbacterium oleivorans]QLD12326.1 hypothetical protein HW566_11395 [Microbacterium oleivorans]